MLKTAAMVFGIVFVLIGVLGFIPGITNNGMLLGIFHVDTLHNIIHLASGAAALALMSSTANAKLYFQIFGVVYALVTILGFVQYNDTLLLGFLATNPADDFLHLVIAIASLYLGFGSREAEIA